MFQYFSIFIFACSHRTFAKEALQQITEPVDHAEGPFWDERTNILYFVDMFNGMLNRYHVKTGKIDTAEFNGDLTLVIPCEYSQTNLVIGLNRAIKLIDWPQNAKATDVRHLATMDKTRKRNRLNDGKADAKGRLWIGTLGHVLDGVVIDINAGNLYYITNENLDNPRLVIGLVNISNGLAWNKENTLFYFVDTTPNTVTEYDYDNESGAIAFKRVVFQGSNFPDVVTTGLADGMAIDVEGNLWIALYGGGAVIRFDPKNNRVLRKIDIPANYTTAVCWGGPNYETLYVTTSRFLLKENEKRDQPKAGSIFTLTGLGTRGVPNYLTRVGRGTQRLGDRCLINFVAFMICSKLFFMTTPCIYQIV